MPVEKSEESAIELGGVPGPRVMARFRAEEKTVTFPSPVAV
jgi:hypothetical protein